MARFLHVGCGSARQESTSFGYDTNEWQEVRLDIDPGSQPDIISSLTDMSAVPSASFDGLYSSHSIEHVYPHEVPVALGEFRRVLKADGFAVITCPDLQSVCALVAQDKLTDVAYESPAGPITPLDIMYGHVESLAAGNLFMAHRTGFTERTFVAALKTAGFGSVSSLRRQAPFFDLWAIACVTESSPDTLQELCALHFPY